MKISLIAVTALVTINCLVSALSIPQVERKPWTPHRSKREECEGPDCLSSSEEVHNRRGAAAGPSPAGGCLLERAEKIRTSNKTAAREFIPKCEKDGGYSSVQCHPLTKSCWCVTELGKPIPGTTVLILSSASKKPNCSKYHPTAKSATKRRSSHAKKNRKSCNHGDRAQFNAALIKTFRGEYSRYRSISSGSYRQPTSSTEDIDDPDVLTWKFGYLDRNNDGFLEKNETMILKRLVKQQIQPRQCAKTFISFCANGDKRISKKEWLDCLQIGSTENRSTRGMHPFQLLKQGPHSSGDLPQLISPASRKDSDHREVSNCKTDRQSALDSTKSGSNESVIIPECNSNGLYKRTQCARGKPTYCWCVFEETGMEIPDTLVMNSIPDCDKKVAVYKSIQGCSGPKRAKFLQDLLESMRHQMNESIARGQTKFVGDSRSGRKSNEDVVKWHYRRLDVNSNDILERREWKLFKNEIIQKGHLRRCGKRLPRICDKNQDKKLTLPEWLECLGVHSPTESRQFQIRKPSHRSSGPRTGKNPLTTILKQ